MAVQPPFQSSSASSAPHSTPPPGVHVIQGVVVNDAAESGGADTHVERDRIRS